MNNTPFSIDSTTLYLIYDGDCLLCCHSAKAMRLRQSVRQFKLINARDHHYLITMAKLKGLDLNEGIIVFYQDQIWSGSSALHHLALLMTTNNSFNRISSFLFRRQWICRLSYPLLKCLRQCLLWMRNKKRITDPLPDNGYDALITSLQQDIHPIFKKRYDITFASSQSITLYGCLDITFSKAYRYLLPFFKLAGALLSQEGNDIKTTVQCTSPPHCLGFIMNRQFHFPDQPDQMFESEIRPLSDKRWIEITNGFFAWRFRYRYKNQTLSMHHQGYGLIICQRYWPLPGINLLLGKPYGEETALTDTQFKMKVSITHWLFKSLITYEGVFSIEPS